MLEPKILKKEAFTVVGMECVTTMEENNSKGVIKNLWCDFMKRYKEIKNIKNPEISYGLCSMVDDKGKFSYVAGYEVDKTDEIPEGFVFKNVPECDYAVFTHEGSLDSLGETYSYIYEKWFKISGYSYKEGTYDFELYDADFKGVNDSNTKMYIYVPIKK